VKDGGHGEAEKYTCTGSMYVDVASKAKATTTHPLISCDCLEHRKHVGSEHRGVRAHKVFANVAVCHRDSLPT
jgi:hypothetical protein